MKKLTTYTAQLLRRIHGDESFVYSFICYACAVIHFALLILFRILDVLPLSILSLFSVLFYIFFSLDAVKKQRFLLTICAAVTEILLHSVLSCYFLGWEYGFSLYMLAMIPVVFYVLTTTSNIKFKYPLRIALTITLIIIICYILTKIYATNSSPYYQVDVDPAFVTVIYCINCCIAFTMQTIFSFLYTLEIQHFKANLEEEKYFLDNIAKKDPLTSLLNRRAMEPHLNAAKTEAEKKGNLFCLILCDIDNFKKVNDVYGHELGDLVLKEVANTFITNLRTGDVVCRWGGEEFLILIPNKLDITIQLAERLREQVALLTFPSEEGSFSITMTFGVAEYITGYRIEKLIKIADDNLYRGKNNGKNQVVSS